jgi:glucose-6-phosphate 1-dehydrogenase
MNSSPIVVVIFGATGDLTHRKLMPALYRLYADGAISPGIQVIGVGRRDYTDDMFCDEMKTAVARANPAGFDETVWRGLCGNLHYVSGHFEENDLYRRLISTLEGIDRQYKACVPRFLYLATPPAHYETILTHINENDLSHGCRPVGDDPSGFGETRILIEKPFGRDLETSQHLDDLLSTMFVERQIYRIDHYLGKETVQNILAFRFGNGMFEPTWNREFIDHVQITVSETLGIEGRGAFYDGVGALRDIVQNHILQMLALTAMEQPKSLTADAIRNARAEVLKHLTPISDADIPSSTVRGQYRGYTAEPNVDPASTTETFVAVKAFVDTPRWQGVPFYLRTGKRLTAAATEISIHFNKPVCTDETCLYSPRQVKHNVLAIRIQPHEGIFLRLMVKQPGFGTDLATTVMSYGYEEAFAGRLNPDAYERLLLDVIRGDQTLFARSDDVRASWKFVTGILTAWERIKPPLHVYEAGTMGPAEADGLLDRDDRSWYLQRE